MNPLLSAGQRIADYEVLEFVAMGGMGEVYRCRQISLERVVALKILTPRLAKRDPTFAKRFVDEARAAGRLNHPNIVAVHDVDRATILTPDGPHDVDFFSMEFVDGESVKEVIEREGACSLQLTQRVMQGMGEALLYAETHRVIHRDIKPDNIMLTAAGEVKLADLGLAVQAGEESLNDQRGENGRGKVMGTPLYMSPEQARALALDTRSDQYSLGATLFHMLTGQPPFRGEDIRAVMRAHVFSPIPDPAALRPELPDGWCRLCQRLMAKLPAERFENARALRRAIQLVSGGSTYLEMDAVQTSPKRTWLIVAAGVSVAALVAVPLVMREKPAPVKPAPVVMVDAAAETARRVTEALQSQPLDPVAALVYLDRLAADPANASAPASVKAAIEQARIPHRTAIDEARRRGVEALIRRAQDKLDAVQSALDAGRLADAAQQLAAITDLPDAATERAKLLKGKIEAARQTLRQTFTQRITAAETDADLEALSVELAGSMPSVRELRQSEREVLSVSITERRKSLADERARKVDQDERAAWKALTQTCEERRGIWFDLATLIDANQPRFAVADSLAQLASVRAAAVAAVKLEAAIAQYIDGQQPELPVVLDGRTVRVRVNKWQSDSVTITAVGTAPRAVDRRQMLLPLADLVKELGKSGKNTGDQRAVAVWLWCQRCPDAGAAIQATKDDTLTKALTRLEGSVRRLRLAVPPQRNGTTLTATYEFSSGSRLLSSDFSGPGLDSGDIALRWTPTVGVARPWLETAIPTVRWSTSLRLPMTIEASWKLPNEGYPVAIGCEAGSQRFRIALDPNAGSIGLLVTGVGDAVAVKSPRQWLMRRSRQVIMRLRIDADGRLSGSVDGVSIPPVATTLANDADLTPIFQAFPAQPAPAADLSRLSITGETAP